jgi:hypothetical protein
MRLLFSSSELLIFIQFRHFSPVIAVAGQDILQNICMSDGQQEVTVKMIYTCLVSSPAFNWRPLVAELSR